MLGDLLILCHTLGLRNSPNRNALLQINLPINWHGIPLTGTMAYKCFSQGNLINLYTFDGNAWLNVTDGLCWVEKQVIIQANLLAVHYGNCLNYVMNISIYLNAGMGYACPWHKMEKLWPNFRVSSCKRSPDIVGATLPMGSAIEGIIKSDS